MTETMKKAHKGGRPPHPLTRELVEGAAVRPAGQPLRAYVKQWFQKHYGREPSLDESIPFERRIRRRRI